MCHVRLSASPKNCSWYHKAVAEDPLADWLQLGHSKGSACSKNQPGKAQVNNARKVRIMLVKRENREKSAVATVSLLQKQRSFNNFLCFPLFPTPIGPTKAAPATACPDSWSTTVFFSAGLIRPFCLGKPPSTRSVAWNRWSQETVKKDLNATNLKRFGSFVAKKSWFL